MTLAPEILAICGFVAVGLALFAWVVARLLVCAPILDMVPLLADWMQSPNGVLGTLWHPLNEHHVVWMRWLLTTDFRLTGGWPVLSGAVSVLSLACLAWVPARALLRSGLPRAVAQAGVAMIVLLVFAPPSAETTALAMNGVYPQGAGFAMLSLGAASTQRWRTAFALAVIAALGNGAALVLLPILPLLAWRGTADRPAPGAGLPTVIALTLAGLAFGLLYLRGLPAEPHGLPQAMVALRYVVATLGLPASRSGAFGWLGIAAGGVLGLLALALLIRRPRDALGQLAQGGILFGLGVAALAAISRTEMAGGLPALRYTVLVLPLQIGVLCMMLPLVLRWAQPRAVATLLLALAVGLTVQSVLAARAMIAALAPSHDAVARFAAGDRAPELQPYVFPDLAEASRVWAMLASRGLPVCRSPGS